MSCIIKLVFLIIILNTIKPAYSIIGGSPTQNILWPSLVLVKYHSGHFCGGTFIRRNWVLTIAQCIDPKIIGENVIQGVGLGFHDLDEYDGQVVPYRFLMVHPSFAFSGGLTINDIALIRLPHTVRLPPTIHSLNVAKQLPNVGTPCKTAGWGMISINIYVKNVTDPNELFHKKRIPYEVEQIIVDIDECIKVTSPGKIDLDESTHICARSSAHEAGPSFGDFGGPLVCNDEQVAVSSFVIYNPKVSPYLYALYTPILKHQDWISQVIAINPGPPPPKEAPPILPTKRWKEPRSKTTTEEDIDILDDDSAASSILMNKIILVMHVISYVFMFLNII